MKLSDFGTAKSYECTGLTQDTAAPVGTIAFMAPELLLHSASNKVPGKEETVFACRKQSDIWSLGCTLLMLYTGKMPWKEFADNWMALLFKMQSDGQVSSVRAPQHRRQTYTNTTGHPRDSRRNAASCQRSTPRHAGPCLGASCDHPRSGRQPVLRTVARSSNLTPPPIPPRPPARLEVPTHGTAWAAQGIIMSGPMRHCVSE